MAMSDFSDNIESLLAQANLPMDDPKLRLIDRRYFRSL